MQIKDRIRKEFGSPVNIDGDETGKSNRLPTLEELQLIIKVSRPTISKALAALTAEGFLVKEKGRGAFALAVPAGTGGGGRTGRANVPTIGFIAPLYGAELPQRAFVGIDRVAHRRGFRVVMAGSGDSVERERSAAQEMIAAGSRGLIIYPTVRQGESIETDYLRKENRDESENYLSVPVILVDTATSEQGHAQVLFDNRRAGYQITRWLIDRGYSRIALVLYSESVHHPSIEDRLHGYRAALADSGIELDSEYIARIEPSGAGKQFAAAVHQLIDLGDDRRPQAIIALDDLTAIAVIQALDQKNIRVPQDIYVSGFDNRIEARHFQPAFTTTAPDFDALGEVACEMLIDGIEAGLNTLSPRTYIIGVPLLIREPAPAVGKP